MKPFKFKQFSIAQENCAMKLGFDGVLLGAWANVDNCKTALDIGTGTGVIALMCAQRNPQLFLDAVEVDLASSMQANENFKKSKYEGRIENHSMSLQAFVHKTDKVYDLIVSNPPFFKSQNNTKSFDARRQLARQTDGLSFEALIEATLSLLTPNGRLSLILPFQEGNEFVKLARSKDLYLTKSTNVKTRIEKPIERRLLEFQLIEAAIQKEELIVQKSGKRHDYTEAYIRLVKDFYTIL